MLIYARLILILILIVSVLQVVGGVMTFNTSPAVNLTNILLSSLVVWLAYSNYVDAAECANKQ